MDSEWIRRLDAASRKPALEHKGETSSWWYKYAKKIETSGITESAIKVIDIDSDYIINQGILGAGKLKGGGWPSTRLRRGLVMGAVQSGKTASLIAVTTKALDHGVDIVVILAGTRIALWRQTYERILSQLDGWSSSTDQERRKHRVLLPSPSVIFSTEGAPDLESLYFETPNLVRRLLINNRPLVAVVMKQADHLMCFSKYLHRVLAGTFEKTDRLLHMLVIDDEADDGSILDSEVENGLAPDAEGLKQIPRHIVRLWSGHHASTETLHNQLFATYLAYTATPQANFLQADHNPLSPSDFLAALRVPLDEGSIAPPRSTTFNEPLGIAKYYSGGELFYRKLSGTNGSLCITRAFPVREDFDSQGDFQAAVVQTRSELLANSLRAYFVSGAIRLLLTNQSLSKARSATPDSEETIRRILPQPHSMLFHPSARVDTHFIAADEIVAWSAQYAPASQSANLGLLTPIELPTLNVSGLVARLDSEEDLWKHWLAVYEHTRERISFFPGGALSSKIDESRWVDIRRILIEEVFPCTRLAVINSDPRADDRPKFQPQEIGDNLFVAPQDIFTIFISGNVMARGITIEGLVTTLFLRSANEPLADTQMQMQRWFGYRGRHLNWCRVFMFEDQLNLFRAYHENDEAVRQEIVGEMNMRPGIGVCPLVLQGSTFRATGKIANLRALPLCPGSNPFVRVIETEEFAPHNAGILVDLLRDNQWGDIVVSGTLRGKAMQQQLGLIEVAKLLESLRYAAHNPSPSGPNHERWRSLASELNLSSPEAPLYRPPQHLPEAIEKVNPPDCPYSIAAYLRFWNALLTRRARGIYPTDDRCIPWSMIDLVQYAKTAPRFFVGIRYGSEGLSNDSRLATFGVQRMKRESHGGVLISTWGSRNPGKGKDSYFGDQLFDYHIHNAPPPTKVPNEPIWRKRGAPGLLLFHVIRGTGSHDAVTVGLALPLGGPDHIAALRSS